MCLKEAIFDIASSLYMVFLIYLMLTDSSQRTKTQRRRRMFMAKFIVTVTRTTTESTELEIDANSEEEALEKATSLAEKTDLGETDSSIKLDWAIEDCEYEAIEATSDEVEE
jgi:hypothetical protein